MNIGRMRVLYGEIMELRETSHLHRVAFHPTFPAALPVPLNAP